MHARAIHEPAIEPSKNRERAAPRVLVFVAAASKKRERRAGADASIARASSATTAQCSSPALLGALFCHKDATLALCDPSHRQAAAAIQGLRRSPPSWDWLRVVYRSIHRRILLIETPSHHPSLKNNRLTRSIHTHTHTAQANASRSGCG